MHSAMHIAMGTAMSSAMNDVMTVPNAREAMPNLGGLSLGNQFLKVRKFAWFALSAGIALAMRNTPIATMIARTTRPAELVSARKPVSRLHRRRRASVPPGGGGPES